MPNFYSERPLLFKIFYSIYMSISIARSEVNFQRSVAWDFGGVSQIKPNNAAFILFSFFCQTLESNTMVYHKKVSNYRTFTLIIT